MAPPGPRLDGPGGAALQRLQAAAGLAAQPHLAEIWPVGGAGDRLGLVCPNTGESLPVAVLPHGAGGRTLLEGLARDLQAREYLAWRVAGGSPRADSPSPAPPTPVVVMTSAAKGNHRRILSLLRDELSYVGRPADSFRLLEQPMVPMLDSATGRWLTPVGSPLQPSTKPGGHGALWKLMLDAGAFDWLRLENHRVAAVVRQISNPLAGADGTLLALAGAGHAGKKRFGFASCPRREGASEGVNVLLRRTISSSDGGPSKSSYGVGCVEYTEFRRVGLDVESNAAALASLPANTNVLYVDLEAAERAVVDVPGASLPGLIFNRSKTTMHACAASPGSPPREVRAGRLETTMQALADAMMDVVEAEFESDTDDGDNSDSNPQDRHLTAEQASRLSTFVLYNRRAVVTSSAKRAHVKGSSLAQTPDGSYLDLARNAADVLASAGWAVPAQGWDEASYMARGPPVVFDHHPALGPLWECVRQKLGSGGPDAVEDRRRGDSSSSASFSSLADGSELVLELAEARLCSVSIDGSLRILAARPMGDVANRATIDDAGYDDRGGRVRLERCSFVNDGIDRDDPDNVWWRGQVARRGGCTVLLEGRSEFDARDVTVCGDHTFVVPDGWRFRLLPPSEESLDGFRVVRERLGGGALSEPSWWWEYRLRDDDAAVVLTLVEGVGQSGQLE